MLSSIFIWLLLFISICYFVFFFWLLLLAPFLICTHTQSRIAIGFVFRFTEDLKTNAIFRIRMRIRESRTIRTRHDMGRYGMITARYVAPQAFASQLSDSL